MSRRRLSAYLDALAAGRRPKGFRATADDAEVVRAATTLRAARPGDAAPDPAFVEGLFRRLSEQAAADETPDPRPEVRPVRVPRRRVALVAVAASGVLVAGTVVATETLHGSSAGSAVASPVPHGAELRTATFQTTDGRVLGQIVAYRGKPSWVFMNVNIPNYEGRVECMLQVADGRTVAFGTFTVHGGVGTFSKAIGDVNVGDLRGAQLVDPGGSAVAAATFA